MGQIVISGGGTGIGLAAARLFGADGNRVHIIGRRPHVVQEAAAALNTEFGEDRVVAHAADLTEIADVERVAGAVAESGDPVDVLVNNAGGNFGRAGRDAALTEIAADYRANFEGNVLTAVLLTHALIPQLARPGGAIVSVSSIAAVRGPGSYGGAKAQLHAVTFEWAAALAADGIRATAVAPGFTEETEFFGARMSPEFHAGRVGQTLLKKPGTPEEIAEAIKYLAGATNVTGEILHINGGAALGR
ncbi:SDR family oxidoreductase [Catenulispora yoronensis]|uniref:SDR family oxidoreductase n=1 Tax=Catenulispora yoronensis TaxID=450799 RepID=A0ABP5FVN7_9ACTN